MRFDTAQLAVEAPVPGLRVVRVAGVLDQVTTARLARVAGDQLARLVDEPGPGHILVDVAEVRFFGDADLAALVKVRDDAREVGVGVHITGLAAREAVLPMAVTSGLAQFTAFPTLEQALRELVERSPAQVPPTSSGPRSRYGWPCPPVSAASDGAHVEGSRGR